MKNISSNLGSLDVSKNFNINNYNSNQRKIEVTDIDMSYTPSTDEPEEYDFNNDNKHISPSDILENANSTRETIEQQQFEKWSQEHPEEAMLQAIELSKKELLKEKEDLIEQYNNFTYNTRGEYLDLWTDGYHYLTPEELKNDPGALSHFIAGDIDFPEYDTFLNGRELKSGNSGSIELYESRQIFYEYIDKVYTQAYNRHLKEYMGMTYEEYENRIVEIDNNLNSLESSDYALRQYKKEIPFIEMTRTEEYNNYLKEREQNPDKYTSLNSTLIEDGKYLTEDEKLMCCYLLDTKGENSYEEYIEAITDKINQRKGAEEANEFLDSITDENGNIDYEAASVFWEGIQDGTITFFEGISNIFNSDGIISENQYKQMFILQALAGSSATYINDIADEIKQKDGEEAYNEFLKCIFSDGKVNLEYAKLHLTEDQYNNLSEKLDIDGSFMSNFYEIGMSVGNMLPVVAVSTVVTILTGGAGITVSGELMSFGQMAGLGLMGLSVFGNAQEQALQNGKGRLVAITYGLLNSLSEVGLEFMLGGILGLSKESNNFIIDLLNEGREELIQEFISAGIDAVVYGNTIDIGELSADGLKSFLYGAITAGIMNTGSIVVNLIINGTAVVIDNINDLINIYKQIDIAGIDNLDLTNIVFADEFCSSASFYQNYSVNGKNYDNLITGMEAHDAKYGQGSAINELYNYLYNGGDITKLSRDGGFRQLVSSLSRSELETYFNNIIQIYNKTYSYRSTINSSSDTTIRNLEQEILLNMPNADYLTKARYLYLELCKRLSYDVNYVAGDNVSKQNIYNKKLNFGNLDTDSVICKGWSELYAQLLIDAGFPASAVKICGSEKNGAHKWVEITFNDYIIRCDATDVFNHSTDLSNAKSGSSTNGFIALDKSYSGVHITNAMLKDMQIDSMWLRDIDHNLGYTTEGKYFNEMSEELIKEFYSPGLLEKIFGVDKDKLLDAKMKKMLDIVIPENMKAYEAYAYFQSLKHMLFTSDEMKKFGIGLYYREVSPNNYSGVVIINEYTNSGITCRIIDDYNGSSIVNFENMYEFTDYIKNNGIFVNGR